MQHNSSRKTKRSQDPRSKIQDPRSKINTNNHDTTTTTENDMYIHKQTAMKMVQSMYPQTTQQQKKICNRKYVQMRNVDRKKK